MSLLVNGAHGIVNGDTEDEKQQAEQQAGDGGDAPTLHEQRFLLHWHRHGATITDHLLKFFERGLFADVTLNVEGHLLKAHRLILASCSSYFLRMFQEADMNNVDHPYIMLINTKVADVRAILDFIYTGECCVFKHRVPEFLAVAKSLKIIGLTEMSVQDYKLDQKPMATTLLMPAASPKPVVVQAPPPVGLLPLATPPPPPHPPSQQLVQQQQQPAPASGAARVHRDVPETCKCFVCGKYLSNQYNLRVHMETHNETFHACTSCPHVSRSRDALRKHMSYRHPEQYGGRKYRRHH